MITDADLEALLELPVLVVLDEAYIEFADEPSRIKCVLRTGLGLEAAGRRLAGKRPQPRRAL
jgi:hypothetical protein